MNSNDKKVLIVEDDDALRELFSMSLALDDYTVQEASNGEEALSLLAGLKKQDLPDCIVLDLMMPMIDGNEFMKIVRQNFHQTLGKIPVILCSASGDVEHAERFFQILTKPVALNALGSAVKVAIESRRPSAMSTIQQ